MTYPNVLPLDLYLKLEKRRKENRDFHGSASKDQQAPGGTGRGASTASSVDKNFLAECEHIHNKVLFDSINDSLL